MTSASSFGRLVTDIDVTLDRRLRDVIQVPANSLIVTQSVFKAGDIAQLCGQGFARVLLPSAGVEYTYDQSVAASLIGQPCACAPDPVSGLTIGGAAVQNDASQSYRITVNSFLADGGDLFSVLREGTDRLGGEVETDALEAYLALSLTGTPIAPPALDRIDVVPRRSTNDDGGGARP